MARLEKLARTSAPFGHLMIEMPFRCGEIPRDRVPAGIGCRYPANGSMGDAAFLAIENSRLMGIRVQPSRVRVGHFTRLTPEICEFASIANELGKALVSLRIPIPVPVPSPWIPTDWLPIWPAISSTHRSCSFIDCIHWLAWSGECPGLKTERQTWSNGVLLPYDRASLERMRSDPSLEVLGVSLDDIEELMDHYYSELTDVVGASVATFEWLMRHVPEASLAAPADLQNVNDRGFQCSKAELLRALGKDETTTKFLDQLKAAGRLVMEDAETPVGHARYLVRFTEPEEHANVIDAIKRNRTPR